MRPPSTTPSIAVEHQVAERRCRRRPAGGRRGCGGGRGTSAAANPSRYITPYQWILQRPERRARSGRSGAGTIMRSAIPDAGGSRVRGQRAILPRPRPYRAPDAARGSAAGPAVRCRRRRPACAGNARPAGPRSRPRPRAPRLRRSPARSRSSISCADAAPLLGARPARRGRGRRRSRCGGRPAAGTAARRCWRRVSQTRSCANASLARGRARCMPGAAPRADAAPARPRSRSRRDGAASPAAIAAAMRCSASAGNRRCAERANRCRSRRAMAPRITSSRGATAPAHAAAARPAAATAAEATAAATAAANRRRRSRPSRRRGRSARRARWPGRGRSRSAAPMPPTSSSDEISQATPPAAPPPTTPRSSDGARPKMPRATCATMKAANSANSQSPPPSPLAGRLSAIGAGSGSPSISLTSAAVASVDAAGVVAGAEFRHQVFLDDAVGDRVGDRAFQPIAGLDAHATVVLGDDQQHAVVDALAPELALLERAHRVLLDVFGLRRRHHQHLQLAALALLQRERLLLRAPASVRGIERAGGVDHRRVERAGSPPAAAPARARRRAAAAAATMRRAAAGRISSDATAIDRRISRRPARVAAQAAAAGAGGGCAAGCPKSTVGALLDLRFVLDGEVRLGLVAEHHRGQVHRELADVGVVVLHRLDVAAARDGDAVLGAFQLRLQVAEVLVGLEVAGSSR